MDQRIERKGKVSQLGVLHIQATENATQMGSNNKGKILLMLWKRPEVVCLQAKFSLAVQTITLRTQDFSWSSGFPWYPTLPASVSFRFSPHVPQMAVTMLTLSLPLHNIQGKSVSSSISFRKETMLFLSRSPRKYCIGSDWVTCPALN